MKSGPDFWGRNYNLSIRPLDDGRASMTYQLRGGGCFALKRSGMVVAAIRQVRAAGKKVKRMVHKTIVLERDKRIALVAHDNMKADLLEWAKYNRDLLAHHQLYATGTTGKILESVLSVPINKLQSGPLGGDQQIGAMISNNEIDFLIFFWDPLEPMPHDPDVKALLRMAVVWNIPIACNRASADFIISSPLMDAEYQRLLPDYDLYRARRIDLR
jgi:methylglyoxal synthase